MIKKILILFTIILTSFYFFPFEFSFLPSVNTKMAMAGVGLFVLAIKAGQVRESVFNKDIFILSIYAIIVSVIGFFSVVYNNTIDYTYATYIISMWVWLSAAFVTVVWIKQLHGEINLILLCNYLIAVCVSQCIVALTMDMVPAVKAFVDGFLASKGFMGQVEDRMYGIGASLDVAGGRFSAVLIMIAYILQQYVSKFSTKQIVLYLVAFLIISVIGNMMARTTIIGVAASLLYWLCCFIFSRDSGKQRLLYWVSCIFIIGFLLTSYLYSRNESFYENIRFAFEGFFSLSEKGTWEVHSNDILKDMIVFPDNLKTWIIGDGYIENPYRLDPNYVGQNWGGFYQGTDIGYIRFIFYFGVIGLSAFCFYMWRVAQVCMKRLPTHKILFVFLLALNYIIWLKVSTDIFVVFALFIVLGMITNPDNKEANNMIVR